MEVPIIFEDRDEILHLIERNDEISQYFTQSNAVKRCPLIFNNSSSSKFIAKGVQGSVSTFSLGIPGDTKEYVVKKSVNPNYVVERKTLSTTKESMTLKEIADRDIHNIPHELFFSLNGGSGRSIVKNGKSYLSVGMKNEQTCKSTEPIVYDKWWYEDFYNAKEGKNMLRSIDSGKMFMYPEGSFLCDTETYTEYPMGLLCASLYESGKCANFIEIIGFSMCAPKVKLSEKPAVYDYTFMEKIHGSVRKNLLGHPNFSEELVDGIIIQTYFALSSMQRILGIQHNDLHNDNVMFQDITKVPDGVDFDGNNLNDADYFSYDIDGTKIYIRNLGLIAKIADFGFAMKYSSPIVGPKYVADANINVMPAWRDDYYDFLFNLGDMYVSFRNESRLVNVLVCTAMDPWFSADAIENLDDAVEAGSYIYKKLYNLYYQDEGRPSFTGCSRHPWEYLTDPSIMGVYLEEPPVGSKIVSLGSLSAGDYHPSFHDGNEEPLHLFSSSEIERIYRPETVKSSVKISDKKVEKYRNQLEWYLEQMIDLEDSPGDRTRVVCYLLIELNDFILKRKGVWKDLSSGSSKVTVLLQTAKLIMDKGLGMIDISRAHHVVNPKTISEIDDLYTDIKQQLKKNLLNATPRRSSSAKKSKKSSRRKSSAKRSTMPDSLKTPKSEEQYARYIHKNLDNITSEYFTTGNVGEYVRMTTKFILDLQSKNKMVLWLTLGDGQHLLPKMHDVFSIAKTIPNYNAVTSKTYRSMIDKILELTQ